MTHLKTTLNKPHRLVPFGQPWWPLLETTGLHTLWGKTPVSHPSSPSFLIKDELNSLIFWLAAFLSFSNNNCSVQQGIATNSVIKPQGAFADLGDDGALWVLGRSTMGASQVLYLELGNHKSLVLQEYLGRWLIFRQLSSHAQNRDGTNHCGQWHSVAQSIWGFSSILRLSSSAHVASPDPSVTKLLNCPSQPEPSGCTGWFCKTQGSWTWSDSWQL